jgi:hypothetical protein
MADRQPIRRSRRLVFGEVAELYDRRRPGYPPALIVIVESDFERWRRRTAGSR